MNQAVQPILLHPGHTPTQVVQLHLEALQYASPVTMNGIEAAFELNSPTNRLIFGTPTDFAALLQESPYDALIGFDHVSLTPPMIVADTALVRARLTHPDGLAVFSFLLSRQQTDPHADCWMIDLILRDC